MVAKVAYQPYLVDKEGPRLLVCGDRNWYDKIIIRSYIKRINPCLVISGKAPGADTLAESVTLELGIPFMGFPAKWGEHGKAAGPIRNVQMLQEGKPTYIIGFHNNLEDSKGTKHMLALGKKYSIRTVHIRIRILEETICEGE